MPKKRASLAFGMTRAATIVLWLASADQRVNLQSEEHPAMPLTCSGKEQPPLLNKLFSQRHLIDNQIAALFKVMDFNPQILA